MRACGAWQAGPLIPVPAQASRAEQAIIPKGQREWARDIMHPQRLYRMSGPACLVVEASIAGQLAGAGVQQARLAIGSHAGRPAEAACRAPAASAPRRTAPPGLPTPAARARAVIVEGRVGHQRWRQPLPVRPVPAHHLVQQAASEVAAEAASNVLAWHQLQSRSQRPPKQAACRERARGRRRACMGPLYAVAAGRGGVGLEEDVHAAVWAHKQAVGVCASHVRPCGRGAAAAGQLLANLRTVGPAILRSDQQSAHGPQRQLCSSAARCTCGVMWNWGCSWAPSREDSSA